jgi:hypothetical protein
VVNVKIFGVDMSLKQTLMFLAVLFVAGYVSTVVTNLLSLDNYLMVFVVSGTLLLFLAKWSDKKIGDTI